MKRAIGFLGILSAACQAWSSQPAWIRGKVFARGGEVFVSALPGQGVDEYKIQWLKGFRDKTVCYYQNDQLCPDYTIYFRTIKSTPSGPLLIDAIAEAKF